MISEKEGHEIKSLNGGNSKNKESEDPEIRNVKSRLILLRESPEKTKKSLIFLVCWCTLDL